MAYYTQAFNSIYPPPAQIPGPYPAPRYDVAIRPTPGPGPGNPPFSSPDDLVPVILAIDSRSRNQQFYPNPAQYSVFLPTMYKDVVSIELVSAQIPNSGYAVNPNNDLLYFSFHNYQNPTLPSTFTATIANGNYDIGTFCTALANAMNYDTSRNGYANANQLFTVSANPITQKIIITPPSYYADNLQVSITNTTLSISSGQLDGCDTLIGLGNNGFTGTNGGTYTLPYVYVLQPYRYVVLQIQQFTRCDGLGGQLGGCFAIIPYDATQSTFSLLKDGNIVDNETYKYYSPQPIPAVTRLDIALYAPDGTLMNFNGQDHILIFELVSLTRPLKYGRVTLV
jgi:hypothetical protein